MSKKDDESWVQGFILLGPIIAVFYGLAYSNQIQIIGGLSAFIVFASFYSILPHLLLAKKQVKKEAG